MKDKILAVFGGSAGLKECFIAGGAITSLVTNKPINDWDIYPKSTKARDEALVWMYESGYWNAHVSSRALTFVNSDSTVQIMLFEMKSMGDFIRWVFNDIMKEEMDTMIASQIDPKKLGGPIANIARPWFINKLNSETDV